MPNEEVLPSHYGSVMRSGVNILFDCTDGRVYLEVKAVDYGRVIYMGYAYKETVLSVCDVIAKNIAIQLRERIESLYAE